MATARPFAYNPSQVPIQGTTQFHDLAIGEVFQDYATFPGGVEWWMGPDEDPGWIIAFHVNSIPNHQFNPTGGEREHPIFWRSSGFSEAAFITCCNRIPARRGESRFANVMDALTWLDTNGYWTNYAGPQTPNAWRLLNSSITCSRFLEFTQRKNITGLSSPSRAWYDADPLSPTYGRVWVADNDNYIKGNVYWFDPVTALTEADMVYSSSGLKADSLYTTAIDEVYRRIYFVGRNSLGTSTIDGLVVYSMDTDTYTTIPYGTSDPFTRTVLFLSDTSIFVNAGSSLLKIDRANPDVNTMTTISLGAGQSFFYNGTVSILPAPTRVENRYWAVGGAGSSNGNIGVFDLNLNYISTINLPGISQWSAGNNAYWGSSYYDSDYNKFYYFDVGSENMYILTPDSSSNFESVVEDPISYQNMHAEYSASNSFATFSWTLDPSSNKLYATLSAINSPTGENAVRRMYEVDRATGEFIKVIPGIAYSQLISVNDGLANSMMGVQPGTVQWGSGPWNTDGSIIIFNNTIAGDNDGYSNGSTLEEYGPITNLATGVTKPNIISDPDYIAPSLDPTNCPIPVNLNAPLIIPYLLYNTYLRGYELQIPIGVVNNPDVSAISVVLQDLYGIENSIQGIPQPIANKYVRTDLGAQYEGRLKIYYLDSNYNPLAIHYSDYYIAPGLKLIFENSTSAQTLIGGDPTNVANWNSYLGIVEDVDAGVFQYTEAISLYGNTVIVLKGGSSVTLNQGKFGNGSGLVEILDTGYTVAVVSQSVFFNNQTLTTVSLDGAYIIGNSAFAQCQALTSISILSCFSLGDTSGDDSVFNGITGNTIDLTMYSGLTTDGDVVYLDSNNQLTINTPY